MHKESKTKKTFLRLPHILLTLVLLVILTGITIYLIRLNLFPKPMTNVILISIDTTRSDHMSVYGYERETTPHLRIFAKEGTRFDWAYAPTGYTAPNHATLFTSLYPITHGLINNGQKMSKNLQTIAEHLQFNGFQTAGFAGSFVMDSKFGFAQGFDLYDDDFEWENSSMKDKTFRGHKVENGFDRLADDTTNKVIDWLQNQRNPNLPFFVFIHYFDPHSPFSPPEPYLSKFASKENPEYSLKWFIARYDAEIAFVDHEIGNLLQTLKQLNLEEDTIVIVTADHGEGLMQHHYMHHGIHIYEEIVRVPLLFRWPNRIQEGNVIHAPVELLSVAPTIFDLLEIPYEDSVFQGESLAEALLENKPLYNNKPIYLHRSPFKGKMYNGMWIIGEKFGIRRGKWKYIEGKKENTRELFDLATDWEEKENLYATHRVTAVRLASELDEWKRSNISESPVENAISEEDAERLKALGYVQ